MRIFGYRPRSSGRYPNSIARVVWSGREPFHRISPRSGSVSPRAMRMAVVSPAPFRPTKPTISPGDTVKVTPSRATTSP